MTRKTLLFTFVLCFTLTAGVALANPPAVSSIQDRQEAALLAQGWQRITDGVLERKLGGNKVETFAFGREGFEWMVQRLEDRLGFLATEYEKYPSDRLRKVILDLRQDIARMKGGLQTSQAVAADSIGAAETLDNCDISYGAHADAYPLSPGPGVGASASAYFYNNCFYWGIVEASVYVRATQGGVTTSDAASQTQEGENVYASAALTRNGLEDCYSTAWARSRSDGLGIVYETSDFNDYCPPPPLSITINGPTSTSISGYTCRTLTWTTTISGGVPPYNTVNWYRDGYWVGSGGSYTETFCGDNIAWTEYVNLTAAVYDSVWSYASDGHTTRITYLRSSICDPYLNSPSALICPVEPL